MFANHCILVFVLCGVGVALGSFEDDMKANFARILVKCMKHHPVEIDELFHLKKLVVPTKPKVKCLLACAYKKEGIIDEKGLYNASRGYEIAEEFIKGDTERLAQAKKLNEACTKVNEIAVSEGDKNCDRAAHIFKCGVDNAEKYGFKLI